MTGSAALSAAEVGESERSPGAGSRVTDRRPVTNGDNDDDRHRVFRHAEPSPITHAVAPIAMLVAAQGFAEGGGIGRAADAFIRAAANFRDRGGAEIAEIAQRRRFNSVVPAYATPRPR